MQWIVLMAPVPSTVEFAVPTIALILLGTIASAAPLLLAVRATLCARKQSQAGFESPSWPGRRDAQQVSSAPIRVAGAHLG